MDAFLGVGGTGGKAGYARCPDGDVIVGFSAANSCFGVTNLQVGLSSYLVLPSWLQNLPLHQSYRMMLNAFRYLSDQEPPSSACGGSCSTWHCMMPELQQTGMYSVISGQPHLHISSHTCILAT